MAFVHAQVFFYFPANGLTNPDMFLPKTFLIPRGIIPQNFSSLVFAVSEELGKKHPIRQLTHSLTDGQFNRVISLRTNDYKIVQHCCIMGKIDIKAIHYISAPPENCFEAFKLNFFLSKNWHIVPLKADF